MDLRRFDMRFKEFVKALSLILTASIILGLFSVSRDVSAAEDISLSGSANVQRYGVIDGVWDASSSTLTLSGKDPSDEKASYRQIEAITVNINNPTGITGSLKYKVYVQRLGWQDFKDAGTEAGTVAKGLKIEALKMELTGDLAEQYRIEYAVVLQKYGNNQGFVSDGSLAGTIGETKLIEEIKIRIVPADTGSSPSVNYRVHRDSSGWETKWSKDGVQSGAAGKGNRIDSLAINLTGSKYKGGITYRSYLQKTGWEKNWSSNGDASGIQGNRIEEIQIDLTGEVAKHYDVYYRVYVQDFGWLGWAKNGASCGTKDLAKQLEAVQVILVLKDKTAPAEVDGVKSVIDISEVNSRTPILPGGGLFKMGENALVSYAVKTKNGWSEIKSDGDVLEVTDPVIGIAVGVDVPDHYLDMYANYPYYGESVWDTKKYDAKYSLRIVEDKKNLEYVSMILFDGDYEEGPDEEGNEDEEDDYEETSYSVNHTAADGYDIFYRVRTSGYGWMAWSNANGRNGTDDIGNTITAIQIVVLPEGQKPADDFKEARSDTENTFVSYLDCPEPYIITDGNAFAKWCVKTFPKNTTMTNQFNDTSRFMYDGYGYGAYYYSVSKKIKYRLGGASKKTCDCSGFVVYVMKKYFHKRVYHGMYKLSHSTGKKISYSQLKPGDWLADWHNHHGWVSFYVGKDNYGHEVVLKGYVLSNSKGKPGYVVGALECWDVQGWLDENPKHTLKRK